MEEKYEIENIKELTPDLEKTPIKRDIIQRILINGVNDNTDEEIEYLCSLHLREASRLYGKYKNSEDPLQYKENLREQISTNYENDFQNTFSQNYDQAKKDHYKNSWETTIVDTIYTESIAQILIHDKLQKEKDSGNILSFEIIRPTVKEDQYQRTDFKVKIVGKNEQETIYRYQVKSEYEGEEKEKSIEITQLHGEANFSIRDLKGNKLVAYVGKNGNIYHEDLTEPSIASFEELSEIRDLIPYIYFPRIQELIEYTYNNVYIAFLRDRKNQNLPTKENIEALLNNAKQKKDTTGEEIYKNMLNNYNHSLNNHMATFTKAADISIQLGKIKNDIDTTIAKTNDWKDNKIRNLTEINKASQIQEENLLIEKNFCQNLIDSKCTRLSVLQQETKNASLEMEKLIQKNWNIDSLTHINDLIATFMIKDSNKKKINKDGIDIFKLLNLCKQENTKCGWIYIRKDKQGKAII